ncbi:MBOAT family O-acyltransferase [Bosea sp. 124]|uniref:MBOAT family O-acyltransferase n=1 Tax=Bosea sp. 124 TaxID=2135642 RepID=UPI000D3B6241|nr:MBOAT family O-acyltransferase [Bosea sp. 124]PTM42377.1 D-alanyl-lipoteichoic acid acyltransferase DltB (MBOAT superfamily) [Bosea sp. 124]
MLFNSFAFLLAFLPLALGLHWLVERFAPRWRLSLLLVLSLAFYAYWDWRFLPLLAGSILLNWLIAEAFQKTRSSVLVTLAIVANLAILALFKYFNFFADLAAMIPGLPAPRLELALPLGISFFTFHHVMYLTDLRRGQAPHYDLVRYGLYIAFFPQVLAGPLVRWREIMHQFEERPYLRADAAERFARGLLLLTAGLAKKVLLGDPLAEYANPVFAAAAAGQVVSVAEAWQGTLAFTFQIYFDFSGYTDMALGLALLFGIVLPQNFDVPYRSASIQDFWRRWHMTLSRFLRDYLYIALGGSRHGLSRQIWALFATMALGGLWHGAGLTFVAWGAAHGLALIAALLWRRAGLPMPALLGWLLTFLFVTLCWVLFRATNFEAALAIYKGLFGLAPIGTGFKWRALLPAAAFAIIGPTAWALVNRLPPARWLAVAAALLFVLILFKIGEDANYEFIYFQF